MMVLVSGSNPRRRQGWIGILLVLGLCHTGALAESDYTETVQPIIERYCLECHGGERIKGQVDFSGIKSRSDLLEGFRMWETAMARLLEGEMPPEDKPQPTAAEKKVIHRWYQSLFVDQVEAQPGVFQPRRLSANEYRHTLESLFGFELKVSIREAEQTVAETSLVMKLLPPDPPGPSGFTNDTSATPLTPLLWNQYAYIADLALDRLFSAEYRSRLEALSGPVPQKGLSASNARQFLTRFRRQVFRRPRQSEGDANKHDWSHLNPAIRVERVREEVKADLVSPAFLYRGLLMAKPQETQHPVDAYELAERLSYFLWNDMPDETLFHLAETERLYQAGEIDRQVTRLLAAPELRTFIEDFFGQWLALSEIDRASKQVPYRVALRTQVLDFCQYLIRENRPLMELIDSKVTFVNPLLAKFYRKERKQFPAYQKARGIEMEIVPHSQILLEETSERGGVLTMPGILAMNRGPVLRGVWMLERILGIQLPEPPPDVGQVPANRAGESLSFRERFEEHRSNPTCAVCHDKIDPLGFATQGFDLRGNYIAMVTESPPQGAARYQDKEGNPIDMSGRMPNGETFQDMRELKTILSNRYQQPIVRHLVERMLSYALARKLEFYDRPTVTHMVEELTRRGGGYQDLIRMIVKSLPFRETIVASDAP